MDDLISSFFEITKKVRKSFSPVKPEYCSPTRKSKVPKSKPRSLDATSKSRNAGLLDINTCISDATEEVDCFGDESDILKKKGEEMESSFKDDSFCPPGAEDVVYEVEIEAENEEGQINTSHETVEDEDIYGDLESSIFTSGYNKKPSDDKESQVQLEELQKERDDLKTENRRITRLNKTYATNISSLYKTAKNEIDKKNFIIKQLQTRLRDVTATKVQGSTMSKEEIKEILSQCQEANQEAHSQVIIKEIQKSIELMKASRASRKKKFYKFGNMSLYFHKEQIQFKRSEPVHFPLVGAVAVQDTDTISPSLKNTGLDVSQNNSSLEQCDNRSSASRNYKSKDDPTRSESHRSRSRSSDKKGHRSPIRSSARVYDLRNDRSPPAKRWNHYKSRHERREDVSDRKRKYSPEKDKEISRLRESTNHRSSRAEISTSNNNKRLRNRR